MPSSALSTPAYSSTASRALHSISCDHFRWMWCDTTDHSELSVCSKCHSHRWRRFPATRILLLLWHWRPHGREPKWRYADLVFHLHLPAARGEINDPFSYRKCRIWGENQFNENSSWAKRGNKIKNLLLILLRIGLHKDKIQIRRYTKILNLQLLLENKSYKS